VSLPKLAEAGLLEWDRERDTVELTPLAQQLPIAVVGTEVSVGARATSAPHTGD
jgi:hypothetical protein